MSREWWLGIDSPRNLMEDLLAVVLDREVDREVVRHALLFMGRFGATQRVSYLRRYIR